MTRSDWEELTPYGKAKVLASPIPKEGLSVQTIIKHNDRGGRVTYPKPGERILPTDPQARKELPVATGFVDYFPDAMICVADLSRQGNEQHNPGSKLHWDRSKSGDEGDALMRHFLERGTIDSDGIRHSAKVAWRAMAMLQKELEK